MTTTICHLQSSSIVVYVESSNKILYNIRCARAIALGFNFMQIKSFVLFISTLIYVLISLTPATGNATKIGPFSRLTSGH